MKPRITLALIRGRYIVRVGRVKSSFDTFNDAWEHIWSALKIIEEVA